MEMEIRFQGLDGSAALREHTERRAGFALGRFAHALRRVVVRFTDVNGPRGGRDKQCQVTAVGAVGPARVAEVNGDCYAAADGALTRLAQLVGRRLARLRSARRRRSVGR
jgi:putative sigma-54 modulation protein